ncbi:MAG: hypothetical protein KIT09_12100 [Bryobacteraceae bacterium]|nr:hypothetical protein [Bryobacteraceae bacterium]
MMTVLLALLAAPYWESKPPAEWTAEELRTFLQQSPWARLDQIRIAPAEAGGPASGRQSLEAGVQIFLASAAPVREAEREWRKRYPPEGEAAEDEYGGEFVEFMQENPGRYIALAVRLLRPRLLDKPSEVKEMEKRCELKIGARRYKLTGHFLPSPADPYLRLVFPREVKPGDEELVFSLYLPGVSLPYREVTFPLKQLIYRERPEF